MAASKFIAYRNLLLGAFLLYLTVMFSWDHFFPGGRDLEDLLVLKEAGVEVSATITNFDELAEGGKTVKYTYSALGKTYKGVYTLRHKPTLSTWTVAPVTYKRRRPQYHQFDLAGAIKRARGIDKSTLSWKFSFFPVGAFLMLYWGFNDLKEVKKKKLAQDLPEA